jgi:hypothetical protein
MIQTTRNFSARSPGHGPRILRVANPCVNPRRSEDFTSAC